MNFWDTSALVPLLVEEDKTDAALRAVRDDPEIIVWWGTIVECASALARVERETALSRVVNAAFDRLDELSAYWTEIEPHDDIRLVARRLMRVHPLRAGDALQLAAAYAAAEGRPPTLQLITLDERVRAAALKEGFRLVDL